MEPRCVNRGSAKGASCNGNQFRLQWSRGALTAEARRRRATVRALAQLQWSRGALTAEARRRRATVRALAQLQWSRGALTAEAYEAGRASR